MLYVYGELPPVPVMVILPLLFPQLAAMAVVLIVGPAMELTVTGTDEIHPLASFANTV